MKQLILLSITMLLAAVTTQAQQTTSATPALSAAVPSPAQPASPPPAQPGELSCRVVTGRVTDMFAYPLTGVTVMLRSHEKGFNTDAFITNAEGQFMVTSKQPILLNTVLEITAAGYTSLTLPLANCQVLDLSLEPLPGTRFKADGRIKKTTAAGKIH